MLTICKFLSDYFSIPKKKIILNLMKEKKIDEKYRNLELNK